MSRSKCSAEAAGYDGVFGVYCDLPNGHDGLHNDGFVEWRFVDDEARMSESAATDLVRTANPKALDAAATGRAVDQAQRCLDQARKHLDQHRYDSAEALAECAVTWIKAVLPDAT